MGCPESKTKVKEISSPAEKYVTAEPLSTLEIGVENTNDIGPIQSMTERSALNSNDLTKTHDEKKNKQGRSNDMINTVYQPGTVTQPEVKSSEKQNTQTNKESHVENHDERHVRKMENKRSTSIPEPFVRKLEEENEQLKNTKGSTKQTVDEQNARQSRETMKVTPTPEKQGNDIQFEGNDNKPTEGHVGKMENQNSTSKPERPVRKLEEENEQLKKDIQEKDKLLAQFKKDLEETKKNTKGSTNQAVNEQTIRQSREIMKVTPTPEKQNNDIQFEGKDKNPIEGHVLGEMETQSSASKPERPVRKLEEENEKLKKDIQEKDKLLAQFKKDLEETKKENQDLEDEIKQSHAIVDKTMKSKSESKTTKHTEELKRLNRELKQMKTEMEEMKKEKNDVVAKKAKEIRNLEKEKDELLCRLSEMAGRRLTDNNPNIADLSDLNRPTKLAEKYSELYDNEWTDAYSYLETLTMYKGSEVAVITALMTMLTAAYRLSLETAESQLEALRHILNDFHGTTLHQDKQVQDVMKALKDKRKKAVQPNKDLVEKYRKEIEKAFSKLKPSDFESKALKSYLRKCLELCWLMVIQDPPVHLKCDPCKKGELFDKNTFKEYTQAGAFIKYIVWPAVFLEKDGALLCKGVVQCDKGISVSLYRPQGKTVIDVSNRSASLRAPATQSLTTFSSKDNVRYKVKSATFAEAGIDHSGKRNSRNDSDNPGIQQREKEVLIATF